ncbi:MAG: type VI secretion system-associated FHA domain protein TagH [Granulosicoccus sp.]|nr:type VI secretion system-associated FHA domain protein TagH [Granulosicoccus sp.]
MRLTLRLQSFCGQPPDKPQEKNFDRFPVFVGRSPSCDFVLDDISKYISSNHATVLEEQGQILIQDTSSNGVYINGSTESIGRGNTVSLGHGDSLTIGDYSLAVGISANSQSADPFDDFEPSSNPAVVEDPFDPFQGREHDWTPESDITPNSDDNWEDVRSPLQQSEADWADWPADTSAPDPTPAPPPAPAHEPDLDWLPGRSSETVSAPRPIKDTGSVPIAAAPPTRAYAGPSQEPRVSHTTGSAENALLTAAGLDPRDFANADLEQVMRVAGSLLNQSLDGMMVLLQSRTELKNAIRTDVTRLARENNNPLKFSTGPEDALMKLLAPHTQRGFLPPDKAINQAIEDLKAHHLAMLEGMKAAVRSMLVQFDPEKLEAKLEKSSPLAATIPVTREAKLWKLFEEKFTDIREEAVNDFSELFGKEFRKAYDRRINELRKKPDF